MTMKNFVPYPPEKEKWLKKASKFLKGKSGETLTHYFEYLAEFTITDEMRDRFSTAMHQLLRESEDLRITVAVFLMESEINEVREEVFWILREYIFTDTWAMEMVWDRLLNDPNDEVFERVYDLLTDEFEGATNVPLSGFMYAAERLAKAKKRHENS